MNAFLAGCDKWLAQFYGKLPMDSYNLLERAARTLEGNLSRGTQPWAPLRGIRPSCTVFSGIWNWDSAFHVMALSRWNPELAREQCRIFFRIQQENGLFPDVWFENGKIMNQYGKPPVFPWAAAMLEKRFPDPEFRKECVEAYRRNEQFWMNERGGRAYGLFHYDAVKTEPESYAEWVAWESGWDNSPRWDDGCSNLFAIDLNCFMVMFYRAMNELDSSSEWEEKERNLAQKIESTLWNEEAKCYQDLDLKTGKFNGVITPASFMPLFIGIASQEHAAAMAEIAKEHEMPGWPSVSYKDPNFDPTGYWRGRTWLNIAYFALKGLKNYGFAELAEEGRATILNFVRRTPGFICENYNPVTGDPVGVAHFGWSSAFVIEFILNW